MANERITGIFMLLLHIWDITSGQTVYSISEELDQGTFVGNLAKDLNLGIQQLKSRKFRIATTSKRRYFEVNPETGILYVNDRIDREGLCSDNIECCLPLEAIIDDPLQLYRVEICIIDINDNAPAFTDEPAFLNIAELTVPGARFPLESAHDLDIGTNSVSKYEISPNEYFILQTPNDLSESTELVLKKALDREVQPSIQLILTAFDGGIPSKSGTSVITVNVLDINDNAPVFTSPVYKVSVFENVPLKTSLIKLNATDPDEGKNAEIVYSFSAKGSFYDTFDIDSLTGEITVKRPLDFESKNSFELRVQAEDKGQVPMAAHCKVLVEVIDVNDNVPEVTVTSLSSPVKEDEERGTVIALFTVSDKDSGKNGNVHCYIQGNTPFVLRTTYKKYYSLILDGKLDRESCSVYNITVVTTDEGSPPLSSSTVISVQVADVNDNSPVFTKAVFAASITENGPPGSLIITVSAFDSDLNESGQITYSLLDNQINGMPASLSINVNSATGDVYGLKSFDYEEFKMFQFQIKATDGGSPPQSSSTLVTVFVLDANDNSPEILPSYSSKGLDYSETIPFSASGGSFVTRVRAYDADTGYNALLSYNILPEKSDLFSINSHTGEIRTKRLLEEKDSALHNLVVIVKDNGDPSLSSTVTLTVSLAETASDALSEFRQKTVTSEDFPKLNIYLLISIVSISLIFVSSLLIFIFIKCHKNETDINKYGSHMISSYPDETWKSSHSQHLKYMMTDPTRRDLLVCDGQYGQYVTCHGDPVIINGNNTCKSSKTTSNLKSPSIVAPKQPNTDWRYSASLRAGMQSSVHMEESAVLQGPSGVHIQNWPTVSSATPEPEAGEVSPPVGAGINSNSWTFKYGPPAGNPQQLKPGEVPENFIIPGSPAIISIRQGPPGAADDKSDFITFGKKEETKKKKKKKKGKADKKEKSNDGGDH
ncbi:protocadherin alpha-8-like isoform X37 [Erpetoichthys calabaricus]|uniref:protocadherin alpha-8-like isoform X37 n=1 Tax=Erpetoichthys calabaricus TaxID=27687 RepID=UPI00109FAA87|nr:protocadherin alpha-8-like isoform X37 [Erpetoichthys calabaricus]